MKQILVFFFALLPLCGRAWQPDTLRLSASPSAGVGRYGGYKPLHELSTSAPLLAAVGLISKAGKGDYRQARPDYVPKYDNHADDYIGHAPLAVATALNLLGYEGRSSTGRYLASAAMSYAVVAGVVESVKHSAGERRPDGSDDNSFPSGHTATAFVAATILHKEYGQTRSPWFSVAGYGVATATGVMRTAHNRHWASDILVGAGIGIISTDIGYALADIIMRGKGINRQPLARSVCVGGNPSFVRVALGIETNQSLRIGDEKVNVSPGTCVAAEGAYFFCPYIGAGVRARFAASPVSWEGQQGLGDVWTTGDIAAGIYTALPISPRHNLGGKLLYGRRFYGDMALEDGTGGRLNIGTNNSGDIAAGIHYTYTTASGAGLTAFIDYDFARPKLDAKYGNADYSCKPKLHSFTFGAAVAVGF